MLGPQDRQEEKLQPAASVCPAISPDVVEQEQGDEFDDIVPSKAYDMLPVVGLGGSAGSIQALRQFFEVMPEESGMAFVVVLHLAPENASIMDDILGRTTQMPVVQAVDGQKLEANHVYVIPPGKLLSAQNGSLCLTPIEAERGKRTGGGPFLSHAGRYPRAECLGDHPERRGWRRRAGDQADQGTRWAHRRAGSGGSRAPEHAALGDRHRDGRLGAAGGANARAAAAIPPKWQAAPASSGGRAAASERTARRAGCR
jgi:hypothetical protein